MSRVRGPSSGIPAPFRRFRPNWVPVRVKKTRQNKNPDLMLRRRGFHDVQMDTAAFRASHRPVFAPGTTRDNSQQSEPGIAVRAIGSRGRRMRRRLSHESQHDWVHFLALSQRKGTGPARPRLVARRVLPRLAGALCIVARNDRYGASHRRSRPRHWARRIPVQAQEATRYR